MNFKDMAVDELNARLAEIRSLIDTEDADLDALETETRSIKEELEARAAAETKRQEVRDMVAGVKLPENKVIEKEEEKKMPDINEIRSSRKYEEAYLKALRTRDDSEVRALLTTEATAATGYVPVPTALETEIRTAWEEHKLMSLIKKSTFKGNVKIGFELTATGAAIHLEGDDAPNEEVVTLGAVEIHNQMIKKWIRVSDEALEGTTVDTAGYLYKEIAQRIVEKAEEILVGKITAAGTVATATAVGVPQLQKDPAGDTVLEAMALLCGQAGNIKLVMNRGTYPKFVKAEKDAHYKIDAFEGAEVVFTDKLPAITAASTGDVYMIVGDFANGVQANFPNGDQIMMLTDPYTDAQSDLVKIVGRQYVGMAVVGDKRLVNVTKEAAAVTG